MPTYTVTADIYNVASQKLIGELTDDTNGTTPDTDIVDNALERAESVVDSYVGKVYTVPLSTPVDANIEHAVVTLARCYLFTRRPSVTPDEITKSCEDVIKWLEGVRDGVIELAPDVTVAADAADQGQDDELFNDQMVF